MTPLKDVDVDALGGQLYLINREGKFQVYEYQYGPAISFPDDFLEDLISFAKENNLTDKIALVPGVTDEIMSITSGLSERKQLLL